jgi:sugar phosphate isomerase/epimerase
VRFGISTHLFHDAPLDRAHLQAVADRGFDCVELFATRTHFDYHDQAAAARLGEWLREAGLSLHSVHAPITDSLVKGVWGANYSNAAGDARKRTMAVQEAEQAIRLARIVPYRYLVVHLGVPNDFAAPGDNERAAARQSIEALAMTAAEHGVRLALEVIPNALSTPETLVKLIDQDLELPDLGICMDVGHAHVMSEVADGIETVSGHLVTTHIHDNDGRKDSHLLPFEGTIDWPSTLIAFQKVGYDDVLLFELATNTPDFGRVLDRARGARKRFEEMLVS